MGRGGRESHTQPPTPHKKPAKPPQINLSTALIHGGTAAILSASCKAGSTKEALAHRPPQAQLLRPCANVTLARLTLETLPLVMPYPLSIPMALSMSLVKPTLQVLCLGLGDRPGKRKKISQGPHPDHVRSIRVGRG